MLIMHAISAFLPPFVCAFVCFPTRYRKNQYSYRIIKPDTEMFHDESRKTTYYGVPNSKGQGHGHKSVIVKALPAWVFALL